MAKLDRQILRAFRDLSPVAGAEINVHTYVCFDTKSAVAISVHLSLCSILGVRIRALATEERLRPGKCYTL